MTLADTRAELEQLYDWRRRNIHRTVRTPAAGRPDGRGRVVTVMEAAGVEPADDSPRLGEFGEITLGGAPR